MLRILFTLLLTTVLSPTAVQAQNPFLENQGQRTIQAISFEGYERTKLYVLERELGFGVGDNYDATAVNDAWARLEELPFVAYVEIETERPRPGEVELEITVVEEGIFRWQIGLDYSRRLDSQWYGELRLGTVNALGRADELELKLDAWALRQARLRWSNPWILGAARLGVYADVGIFNHAWVYHPAPDAETTEFAIEAGLSREFGPGFYASLAGRWRQNKLEDIPDPVDGGDSGIVVPTGDRSVELDEGSVLASVGFDNLDSKFYPSRGLDAKIELVMAQLSDGYDPWTTADLSMTAFVPVPWIHTIGGFVTHRIASDPLPWYERTFYGGPEDLRGVEFGSDRGDERLRASVEIRRPLFVVPLRGGRSIGLGLHAFSDWGAAWEYNEDMADQKFQNSFGLGAHFNFNTYNYRFEWARFEDDNVFVFEDHFTF